MFSPSAARNRGPILDGLRRNLPGDGAILEIASGSGEHVTHFAAALPHLRWLPGDPDPRARASIAAWTAHEGLTNVAPPHEIDVLDPEWPLTVTDSIAAIVAINLIHISPEGATAGLFTGAARLLAPRGPVCIYGPFARRGVHVAASNAAFDADLKARDPRWGVRDLDEFVLPAARAAGFRLDEIAAMPANNLLAVFRRA